jgi:hypothetical protein
MPDSVVVTLSIAERDALLNLLGHADLAKLATPQEATDLNSAKGKLSCGEPQIAIGVYGGVVQWVSGNPFPIRIYDYDGDPAELPDTDVLGAKCTAWETSPDPNWEAQRK